MAMCVLLNESYSELSLLDFVMCNFNESCMKNGVVVV